MPRLMRIEYPGGIYHVMSRGNRREPLFLDDGDRHDFLKTLAEACRKNHFHLVVETPEGNLVAGMRWKEADLRRRPKGDPGKLSLAARLRRETALTVEEIAGRLAMGSRKSLAPKLHAWMRANE